jgi:transposase
MAVPCGTENYKQTSNRKEKTMPEYWKKVHDEALAGMQTLVDLYKHDEVKDTCSDMECALAFVMKHGSYKIAAKAIGYFNDYKWAKHEIAAHKAEKTPVKAM